MPTTGNNFKSKNLQPKSLQAVTYGCRFNPSQRHTATANRSLTTCAIHDYPAIRWEVSPGYHLWGERKSGEQNALPLLVTGDRQARKPANDGIPHTAVEVLTELANDLVSGAGENRFPR